MRGGMSDRGGAGERDGWGLGAADRGERMIELRGVREKEWLEEQINTHEPLPTTIIC